jgi:glycyl-tRNA synthetase beta chain
MTIQRKDFLFEIGTEELPAKQLETLQAALRGNMLTQLKQAQLGYEGQEKVFATPRRLAILIPGLQTMQPDQVIERKGPSLGNAFDTDGAPTKACLGFAQASGVAVQDLTQRDTAQGIFLFATKNVPGKPSAELLPQIVCNALNDLPIAKPMHWGYHAQAFLRPVSWIVLLLGKEILPTTLFDVPASNLSRGHRFMSDALITISEPNTYESLMKKNHVLPDFFERKKNIATALNEAAHALDGQVLLNEALLNEVTGLIEWPVILKGHFDPVFLSVPNNALIAAMESHQKSFAVCDKNDALLPYFLIVSNLDSKDPSKIIQGNEHVMHARLSDAQFFYKQDCAIPLQNHCADLARVIFQARLGSMQSKSIALAQLAEKIATQLNFDPKAAHEAGLLAKSDLRSHMVGEFPELQGEIGEIYARQQGFSEEIAGALSQHYLPRFSDDKLPSSQTGTALALADRLLNLVGLFGVGQTPTGSKDPFALRRAAIGVCRIIIENQLRLNLKSLLILAQAVWQEQSVHFDLTTTQDEVYDFIIERLRQSYLDQNVATQLIESILSLNLDDLTDIDHRIKSVSDFISLPEAKILAAADKRVRNLLQKENILLDALTLPNPKLFALPEEHALSDALIEMQAATAAAVLEKNYPLILQKTAALKQPIDDFFNHVMVMTEDHDLRHNRLALLARFSRFANQVADMSKLVVG